MAKTFFLKEVMGSGFIINGKRVPWEVLSGDQGVIALDDTDPAQKTISAGLDAHRGKYGIVKISEAEYNEKKNSFPFNAYAEKLKQQKDRLQLFQSPADRASRPAQSASVAADRPQAKPDIATLAENMKAPTPLADGLANAFQPATGRRGRPPKSAQAGASI